MKILVTGGGGFVGSHLVESQLAHDRQVRVIDLHVERLAHVADHPNLEIVQGDITDQGLVKQLLAGVEVVYHLASAHLDVSLSEAHYYRVNVDATLALAQAARAAGVGHMVHCSSVGVMGDVTSPPADERSSCLPTNVYEKSKLAGERAVLQFANETGFPVSVARPAWVYGPRCPRTEKLFRAIGKRRFPFFGRGDNLRHPIYVSDAIRGLELCAQRPQAVGQVCILAGEEPVAVHALVQQISETIGVRPPVLRLPIALGVFGGAALEAVFVPLGNRPPFSRRSVDFFVKNNAYGIEQYVYCLFTY